MPQCLPTHRKLASHLQCCLAVKRQMYSILWTRNFFGVNCSFKHEVMHGNTPCQHVQLLSCAFLLFIYSISSDCKLPPHLFSPSQCAPRVRHEIFIHIEQEKHGPTFTVLCIMQQMLLKKMIGEFPSETQLQHQSTSGREIKWYRNK